MAYDFMQFKMQEYNFDTAFVVLLLIEAERRSKSQYDSWRANWAIESRNLLSTKQFPTSGMHL